MIRVFLDRIYLFSGYLAGLFLIAIFVLMMLLSGGRPLGINIPAGDDFISWCMAATAFLGLAHTFKHGEMIRVGLLIDRLNDNVRHYVEIAALFVGVGWAALAMITEVAASTRLGRGWFDLIGAPAHDALRIVMLFAWIATPALFARRRG